MDKVLDKVRLDLTVNQGLRSSVRQGKAAQEAKVFAKEQIETLSKSGYKIEEPSEPSGIKLFNDAAKRFKEVEDANCFGVAEYLGIKHIRDIKPSNQKQVSAFNCYVASVKELDDDTKKKFTYALTGILFMLFQESRQIQGILNGNGFLKQHGGLESASLGIMEALSWEAMLEVWGRYRKVGMDGYGSFFDYFKDSVLRNHTAIGNIRKNLILQGSTTAITGNMEQNLSNNNGDFITDNVIEELGTLSEILIVLSAISREQGEADLRLIQADAELDMINSTNAIYNERLSAKEKQAGKAIKVKTTEELCETFKQLPPSDLLSKYTTTHAVSDRKRCIRERLNAIVEGTGGHRKTQVPPYQDFPQLKEFENYKERFKDYDSLCNSFRELYCWDRRYVSGSSKTALEEMRETYNKCNAYINNNIGACTVIWDALCQKSYIDYIAQQLVTEAEENSDRGWTNSYKERLEYSYKYVINATLNQYVTLDTNHNLKVSQTARKLRSDVRLNINDGYLYYKDRLAVIEPIYHMVSIIMDNPPSDPAVDLQAGSAYLIKLEFEIARAITQQTGDPLLDSVCVDCLGGRYAEGTVR